MDSIKELIVTGVLPEGSRLPSVRELAGQLAINPNTIQRAYRELESAGFIYSVPGKGSLAGALEQVDESRKTELRKKLREAYTELIQLGEDPETLLRELQEGGNPDA